MALVVKVYGDPVQKGSMKCIGDRGWRARTGKDESRGYHQLVDVRAKALRPWTKLLVDAGHDLLRINGGVVLTGPVDVAVTFTVERPKSVPLRDRPWPITRSSGDVDKHARSILDALTESGLIEDDSQVVRLNAVEAYPDTPGCPDRLDRPGAYLRVQEITVDWMAAAAASSEGLF